MRKPEEQAQAELARLQTRHTLQLPTDKDEAIKVLKAETQRLNGVLETTHERFYELYTALLNKNKELATLKAQLETSKQETLSARKQAAETVNQMEAQLKTAQEALRVEQSKNAGYVAEAQRCREDKDKALSYAADHRRDAESHANQYESLRQDYNHVVKARDEYQTQILKRNTDLETLRDQFRTLQDEADSKRRDLNKRVIDAESQLEAKQELVQLLREQVKEMQARQESLRQSELDKDRTIQRLMQELTTVRSDPTQAAGMLQLLQTKHTVIDRQSDADAAMRAQKALLESVKDAEVHAERLRLESLIKDQEYLKLKALILEAEDQKAVAYKILEEAREDNQRLREEDSKWLERLEQLRTTYETSIDKLCKEVHRQSEEILKSKEVESHLRREVSELSVKLQLQKERVHQHEGLKPVLPPTAGILKLGGLSESKLMAESPVDDRGGYGQRLAGLWNTTDDRNRQDYASPDRNALHTGLRVNEVQNKPVNKGGDTAALRPQSKGEHGGHQDTKGQSKWDDLIHRIHQVGFVHAPS